MVPVGFRFHHRRRHATTSELQRLNRRRRFELTVTSVNEDLGQVVVATREGYDDLTSENATATPFTIFDKYGTPAPQSLQLTHYDRRRLTTDSTDKSRPWKLRSLAQSSTSPITKRRTVEMKKGIHNLSTKSNQIIGQDLNTSSGYGTLSETCLRSSQNSSTSYISNSKNKRHQSKSDTRILPVKCLNGDLDVSMQNLSIGEESGIILTEDALLKVGGKVLERKIRETNSSYLTLEDLKMTNIDVSAKVVNDISVLIPSKGYSVDSLSMDIINIVTLNVNIADQFAKAGLRVFQVSPVFSIQPCEIIFCPLYPAIVHVPLKVEPSPGDEIFCLYSSLPASDLTGNSSGIHNWSSEIIEKCTIKEGKAVFNTLRFGTFVLIIRPNWVYRSLTKDVIARDGGIVKVPALPTVTVSFPKNTGAQDIRNVNAKVYFDTEKSLKEFMASTQASTSATENHLKSNDHILATPIIELEPHGIYFEVNPVTITLPVPDYDEIMSFPGSKLTIWHSDTHASEPSKWEQLHNMKYEITYEAYNGKRISLMTFPVPHFSRFKGMWSTLEYLYEKGLGMMRFFVSYKMSCRAYMQEYPTRVATSSGDTKEENTESNILKEATPLGLQVIVYRDDKEKQLSQMSIFEHKVGQTLPKVVQPGGTICVRVNSKFIEPDADVEAGLEEEIVHEEPNFCGQDFDAQFACRSKPNVKREKGPFGSVSVTRHVDARQHRQQIFNFNLIKQGNEDTSPRESEDSSISDIIKLANTLSVTEGNNWRQFAMEMGMTKQDIHDAGLSSVKQPLENIVRFFRQRGESLTKMITALYKCKTRPDACGPYSGQGKIFKRASTGSSSSAYESAPRDNAHSVRRWSHGSDVSGKSQDSGIPFTRRNKRSSHLLNIEAKKRRRRASDRRRRSLDSLQDDNDNEYEVSDSDEESKNNQRRLTERFLFKISQLLSTPNWRFLGRRLKLSESDLDQIFYDFKNDGYRELTYSMLLQWKQRRPRKCTHANLFIALQKEGMNEVAQKLGDISIDSDSDN